jgi:hypothetical protein
VTLPKLLGYLCVIGDFHEPIELGILEYPFGVPGRQRFNLVRPPTDHVLETLVVVKVDELSLHGSGASQEASTTSGPAAHLGTSAPR